MAIFCRILKINCIITKTDSVSAKKSLFPNMDCWRCCAPKHYKRYGLTSSRKLIKATLAAYFLALYDFTISAALMVGIVKLLEVDHPCEVLKRKWSTICFISNTTKHFNDYSIIRFVLFALMAICGARVVGVFMLILGICTKSASKIKPFIAMQSIYFIIVLITVIAFSAYGLPLLFGVPLMAAVAAVDVFCMPLVWFFYRIYKMQKLSTSIAASAPNNHTSLSTSGNNEIGMRLSRCHTI